jgi:hypothetical protein
MSGYLERIASSALAPGGAVHPVLESIFFPSTYRRMPEHLPGKSDLAFSNPSDSRVPPEQGEGVPPRAWKESLTHAPTARIHARSAPVRGTLAPEVPPAPIATSVSDHGEQIRHPAPDAGSTFQPLVKIGRRSEIEYRTVPLSKSNDQSGEREETQDVHSKNRNESLKSGQEASPIPQSTKLAPHRSVDNVRPLESLAQASGKAQQGRIAESVSGERTSSRLLVTKTQQRVARAPHIELRGDDRPLATERSSPRVQPVVFREAAVALTPDTKNRGKSSLSHQSGQHQREPNEIQIHIGRIEVVAVPPTPAPQTAAPKPQRGAPSLDEYLRRRDGKAV